MLTSDKAATAALGLSRFGLGARSGDRARIESDPRGAFLAEVETPAIERLNGPTLEPSSGLLRAYGVFRQEQVALRERQAAAKAAATGADAATPAMEPPAMSEPEPSKGRSAEHGEAGATAQGRPLLLYRNEIIARIAQIRATELGYVERLVTFWANHFTASAARGARMRVLAGAFEREAIRPHVLGRFSDMLLAVARHPAMLLYLDNGSSIGPNSLAGQRRGKGLNENYARELLELHTVGVHGGYTQTDVTSMALILTGWRTLPPRNDDAGLFAFEERRHEPGLQSVMGKRYAQDGVAQGEAALADLARNPATAAHVAERLACAFVADDPPPALVDRLATMFTETDGDLAAVSRALLTADEAWATPPSKLKSPQEFLFGSLRALDVWPQPRVVIEGLAELGQGLWNPGSPKGYPLRGADWLAPNALVNRLDLAETLAGLAGDVDPLPLADDLLGPRLTDETRTAVRRAGSRAQGLALLVMSPEMQRR